jgi:hypothetical protein
MFSALWHLAARDSRPMQPQIHAKLSPHPIDCLLGREAYMEGVSSMKATNGVGACVLSLASNARF